MEDYSRQRLPSIIEAVFSVLQLLLAYDGFVLASSGVYQCLLYTWVWRSNVQRNRQHEHVVRAVGGAMNRQSCHGISGNNY